MSTNRKKNRNDKQAAPAAGRKGTPVTAIIVLGAAIAAPLGLWGWRAMRAGESPATPTPPEAVVTVPPAVAPKADFQKLKGQWLRPDGGYILELGGVDETGKLNASYLNPKPIHVAKAEASQDGEAIRLFVELRDVNYPGSTYDLAYDPQSDQLKGIYYQAALQQRFEVLFVRMQ